MKLKFNSNNNQNNNNNNKLKKLFLIYLIKMNNLITIYRKIKKNRNLHLIIKFCCILDKKLLI